MTIHTVNQDMAVARLSQISFNTPLCEVAAKLAAWQISKGSLQVPLSVSREALKSDKHQSFVAKAREYFAEKHPQAHARAQITLDGDRAWCLGDARNQTPAQTIALARAHPAIYIRLVLMGEMLTTNAIMAPAGEVSVFSSLGPSVYLTQGNDPAGSTIKTFRADFLLSDQYSTLTCDLTRKVFYLLKQKQTPGKKSKKSSLVDAGDQNTVTFEQLDPDLYGVADARGYPVKGIALNDQVRNSRIYYLNVLMEQVCSILTSAGVPYQHSTFTATHQVTEGFINADELTNLERPLCVVWNSANSIPAVLPTRMEFDHSYGYAGAKKAKFKASALSFQPAITTVDQINSQTNYLFLNDLLDEGGSITLERDEEEAIPVDAYAAYRALEGGTGKVDLYSTVKYNLLMDTYIPRHVFQAMHETPELVVKLLAGHPVRKKADEGEELPPHQIAINAAAEPLRRCLMELSIKEVATGYKPIPKLEQLAHFPQGVQLIATRRLKLGRRFRTLVSYCHVQQTGVGARVTERQTSRWSEHECDLDDFLDRFPFLSVDGKKAKDQEFWIIDPATGDRLRVSLGSHIPKILINNRYSSFEAGLKAQYDEKPDRTAFSKDKNYNLFPYYSSSVDGAVSDLAPNSRIISLQDFGAFARVFIAPAGGLNAASGSSLSLFRDILVYGKDGSARGSGITQHPLTDLYLHSFTSGILVTGENSKMSILEKIARLGIEN